MSLFCGTELAARLERAEAGLMARAAESARSRGDASFAIPVAGGFATYAEADSPYNKVAGLGFRGIPTAAELHTIEREFADRKCPVQVELAHLVDEGLSAVLTDRGYRPASFENVLGRPLGSPVVPVHLDSIEVGPSPADDEEAWLRLMADAVATPDIEGLPSHQDFSRDVVINAERDLLAAGTTRYSAHRAGELAGGAGIRLHHGIAQFVGAATAAAHRRHGIQSALLAARLADATAAGCDLAIVTTQPASKSHQNAQRAGFDLLYTRLILVKNPA
jgi:GNAT superfamily N-acetyltransferase